MTSSSRDAIHSLRGVYAHGTSDEEFSRIYKGKLAEIIDFVGNSLVGRGDATAARGVIQRTRESHNHIRPPSNQDPDPLHTAARRAESRLKNARIAMGDVQKTRDKQLDTLRELEREESLLQNTLRERQLTISLLSILERKSKIQSERLGEIAKLLEALREKNVQVPVINGDEIEVVSPKVKSRMPRADHTRDTLASLQAHTIHLSRLSAMAKDHNLGTRLKEAEQRLVRAITRRSTDPDARDLQIKTTIQALQASAQSRAHRNLEYRVPYHSKDQKPEDLDALARRIKAKEQELQRSVDLSAALTLACAHALQSTTHFVNDTSVVLRDSLRAEAHSARGHTDTLRLSIVNRECMSDASRQRIIFGDGRSFSETLDHIEHISATADEMDAFLQESSTLFSPDDRTGHEHGAIVDGYTEDEEESTGRLQKLMERKVRKAEAGRMLVKDIERLVSEVALISGSQL